MNTIREQIRANKRGSFMPGDFDDIKTNVVEVADLVNQVASARDQFYCADLDKIIRSMTRIKVELGNIRIWLSYCDRRER